MKKLTHDHATLARPLLFVLAAAASAMLAACAPMPTHDHGAMSSGTAGASGMDAMKHDADCPMSGEQRMKHMKDMQEHMKAMKDMKEPKADGAQAASAEPDSMCDMGKKDAK